MVKHRYLQLKAKINYGLLSIFPWHYCNLCNKINKHIICNTCLNKLPQINDNCCQICKKTTKQQLCLECNQHKPYFDQVFSMFRYAEPLNKILHLYKYKKQRKYHILLSYLLSFNEVSLASYDLIIPMPSHSTRIKSRGFDHIELLLSYWLLNKQCNIQFDTIDKIMDTPPQALNKLNSRTQQLDNIYTSNYNFSNLNVLVIDDVITTASTINHLAKFLKQHGANKVDCCALMRTVYD